MERYLELLGDNEDLLIVKGQLLRPEPREKQDGTGYYIVFELKVVKESVNKYQSQFNSYAVIVPAADVKEIAPLIKSMKNQEVLCVIRPSGRIRKGQQGGKYNSIDLYLEKIFLVRDLVVGYHRKDVPMELEM